MCEQSWTDLLSSAANEQRLRDELRLFLGWLGGQLRQLEDSPTTAQVKNLASNIQSYWLDCGCDLGLSDADLGLQPDRADRTE